MSKKFPVNAPCPCGSGKKEKTPLLWRPEAFGQNLVAYTDESGNSGSHLFDPNQPEFWTGTLVTPPSFETVAAPVVAECLAVVGQHELHGNALGLSGIDKIGDRLGRLFAKTDSRFLFTKIDKVHFAATKFADTLLDSGPNKALSLFQYGPSATRLPLAVQLIQLLERDDLVRWWKAFEQNDGAAFSEMMKIPLGRLESLHEDKIYDDRTVQLLRDALTWGMAHPKQLLEGGYHPLHAPNVVAITLIVDMLHTLHEQTGARVVKFIHDEQNQFIKHLRLVHDHSKRFQLDTSNICNPLPVIRGVLTFDCNLESAQSNNRVGLQLIDVVLWLVRRFLKMEGGVEGDAGRLALYVIANGEITNFDRPTMVKHTKRVVDELFSLPVSEQQMKDGMRLAGEFEERRVARMNSPIEDK
jgi:hypothetical protein